MKSGRGAAPAEAGSFPFRTMMGAAIAHLHWTPAAFWSATNHEMQAAQEAIERANAAAQPGGQPPV